MKIPASLLLQMRTCVGAGALLVSAGCDLAPTEDLTPAAPEAAPTIAANAVEVPQEAVAPAGLAGKVASAVDEAKTRETTAPTPVSEIEAPRQLERLAEVPSAPRPPEDVTAFVPFRAPATAASAPARKAAKRPRPTRKVALAVEPQPCDPETAPAVIAAPSTWESDPCPACGRG